MKWFQRRDSYVEELKERIKEQRVRADAYRDQLNDGLDHSAQLTESLGAAYVKINRLEERQIGEAFEVIDDLKRNVPNKENLTKEQCVIYRSALNDLRDKLGEL